jgi:hypothetical protein
MFGEKQQAPREIALRTVAETAYAGIIDMMQGPPCCLGVDASLEQESLLNTKQTDLSAERLHHSIGEVCIAEVASPQKKGRRRVELDTSKGPAPCVGAKKVDNSAGLVSVPAQAALYKEAFTFSEATPQSKVPKGDMQPTEKPLQAPLASPIPPEPDGDQSTGFMDDVKLRADALRSRSKAGRCGLVRERCEFYVEEDSSTTCQPNPSNRGSPRNDVIEFDSPNGDQVIMDLSNILQGFPTDGSALGNSLDESMMGASVDESFHHCIIVPDLPEPRLGETRKGALEAVPQPKSTVCFPAPPVSAQPVVFHAGHHKGWSQRTPPSAKPQVVTAYPLQKEAFTFNEAL